MTNTQKPDAADWQTVLKALDCCRPSSPVSSCETCPYDSTCSGMNIIETAWECLALQAPYLHAIQAAKDGRAGVQHLGGGVVVLSEATWDLLMGDHGRP